jgi:glutamate dehydrogenase (NADP+)
VEECRYATQFKEATYIPHNGSQKCNPLWDVKADYAFPCATQNEINALDAQNLVANGIQLVGEGVNMPTTLEADAIFKDAGILPAPGKAANAGGVAVSGLEMAQNSQKMQWTPQHVDQQLQQIMKNIFVSISNAAEKYSTKDNYVDGANIAGFIKVSEAMIAQGYV